MNVEESNIKEETAVSPSENTSEYTEDERKQMDAFFEAMIKRHVRPRVLEISYYMDGTHKKLDDLYTDMENKKCGLSFLNRSFLKSFDRSFIDSLFNDKYK